MTSFATISRAGAPALIALLAACGAPKAGVRSGDVPPPPPRIEQSENALPGKAEPKRELTKDARRDFESAGQLYAATEKARGWNPSTCRQSADRFAAVVRTHPDLVDAQFMVGLSYHRCELFEDAERAYQQAIRMKSNHGASLSNLGELYYRAGKVDQARQYWDSAIKANGKLIAARINVATLELEQMRKIKNPKDATWKKLEEDARFNLSNVLGVDSDNVAAYTVYGLVYMEGWQANKNRLDLAKLLLDEAKSRNERYAPLQNAYGLLHLHRSSLNDALRAFSAAVELDPSFVEARFNVGMVTLGFRNYELAREMLSKVVELSPKHYDAHIGLGVALREQANPSRGTRQAGQAHRRELRCCVRAGAHTVGSSLPMAPGSPTPPKTSPKKTALSGSGSKAGVWSESCLVRGRPGRRSALGVSPRSCQVPASRPQTSQAYAHESVLLSPYVPNSAGPP